MKNNFLSAIILVMILITACDDNKEIDQDTMVRVYVNRIIAEESYVHNLDSMKIVSEEVYDSFNVTRDEYEYTLSLYKQDKDYWTQFFKKSLDYLDSLKTVTSD